MKIVSLLPSATEMLCVLGLREQLVGVSHECDYPPSVAELPKVTMSLIPVDAASGAIDSLVQERLQMSRSLYTLNLRVLENLQPDLIVTQSLCNVCAVAEDEVQAAACKLPGVPRIINLEPESLDGVFQCLQLLGEATDREGRAAREIVALQHRVRAVTDRSRGVSHMPRVVLLEWIDPPFSCGHWNPELVGMAGGREMIGIAGQPSRSVDWQEVLDATPEVLFVACCGFGVDRTVQDLPILAAYRGWNTLPCVQSGRTFVADGSAYFSRPGPRLVDSLEILAHALHPHTHPLRPWLPAPWHLGDRP